jgi:hypothetical protein
MESEENEPQAKFLLAALQDAQAVVRATDTKITALSFGLAVPITKLAAIWTVCSRLLYQTTGLGKFCAGVTILLFAFAWLVSIAAALRTLFHVDNPAKHVAGDRPTGVFYSANLFQPGIIDVFLPQRLDSGSQFSEFFSKLPRTDCDVRRELAFELMKVIYIRTMKLKRAGLAYGAFSIWLATGGAIWVCALAL